MIQYALAHRNACLADLISRAGASACLLLYTGAPPPTCDDQATGTLLAALPCSNPIGTVLDGELQFGAITPQASAAAATAGCWRLCTSSNGAIAVAQGSVGESGADLNFGNGAAFALAQLIDVTSLSITATGA